MVGGRGGGSCCSRRRDGSGSGHARSVADRPGRSANHVAGWADHRPRARAGNCLELGRTSFVPGHAGSASRHSGSASRHSGSASRHSGCATGHASCTSEPAEHEASGRWPICADRRSIRKIRAPVAGARWPVRSALVASGLDRPGPRRAVHLGPAHGLDCLRRRDRDGPSRAGHRPTSLAQAGSGSVRRGIRQLI